jgi:hypothetical protein
VRAAGRQAEGVQRPLRRSPLADDLEPVLDAARRPTAMARDQPGAVAAREQLIRQVPDEPLAAASLLGPENVADKRNPDGARAYSAPMTLKAWLTKTWCGQFTPMMWTL